MVPVEETEGRDRGIPNGPGPIPARVEEVLCMVGVPGIWPVKEPFQLLPYHPRAL